MCLGIPAKVVERLEDGSGTVEIGSVRRAAQLALVTAGIGDYVILHAGIAIAVIDAAEAERTLELLAGYPAGDSGDSLGTP